MSVADEFLVGYERDIEQHRRNAASLGDYLKAGLSSRDYHIHLVSARCKEVQSAKEKVVRKKYADPATQMTDLYGVRVITYYAEQVDPIVERLYTLVDVDPKNCVDKRAELRKKGLFGYSSVHVVGTVPKAVNRPWVDLRGIKLEIQIRSVLDQAWAEIEHEVVYKSGVIFPPAVRRRFSAIAANFEILEAEFLSLRELSWGLVESYCQGFRNGQGLGEPFDAARLVAAFQWLRDGGEGWKNWATRGMFAVVQPRQVVDLLRDTGISNPIELVAALAEAETVEACDRLASLQGCSEGELSHVTVAGALAGARDWEVLKRHLPGLASSDEFVQVFAGTEGPAG